MSLADADAGFELELQNGVLNLVFEEPSETKFVVSPERAGAPDLGVGDGEKLQASPGRPKQNAFVINGETLTQLLDRLTRVFLQQ